MCVVHVEEGDGGNAYRYTTILLSYDIHTNMELAALDD